MTRNKGDLNEFTEQRNREIMNAYRQVFAEHGGKMDVYSLYCMVSAYPASRFFVSDLQAYRIISKMMRGCKSCNMRIANKRMYDEILKRVYAAIRAKRDSGVNIISVRKIVSEVIRQPAPEMYMGIRQISYIIAKEKRKCYEERKRRLRHLF